MARSARSSSCSCPLRPRLAVPDGDLETYLEHLEPLALEWPADGTVTDGYGPRWGRMHLGLDIGILSSLDVTAAAAGTVTESGYLAGYEGYGNVVVVDVGGRLLEAVRPPERGRRRTRPVGQCRNAPGHGRLHGLVHRHAPPFRAPPRERAGRPGAVHTLAAARLHCHRPGAVSSVGRAPARQAGGRWFEPSTAHFFPSHRFAFLLGPRPAGADR